MSEQADGWVTPPMFRTVHLYFLPAADPGVWAGHHSAVDLVRKGQDHAHGD